jgi:hypothetical protein
MALSLGENDRIAIIRYKNKWHIFCMERWVWVLDRVKWDNAWIAAGFESHNTGCPDRFGITILNEETIEEFLLKASDFELQPDILHQELTELMSMTNCYWDIEYILPRVVIDFDLRSLSAWYSYDDGPAWELHTPSGWKGKVDNFLSNSNSIPEYYKYWIMNGENILLKLETETVD